MVTVGLGTAAATTALTKNLVVGAFGAFAGDVTTGFAWEAYVEPTGRQATIDFFAQMDYRNYNPVKPPGTLPWTTPYFP
jgi:hypothetical protein